MYVPLLFLVGCGMTALAVVMFRLTATDRRRFRGAVRAVGAVVEIVPGAPDAARIRFTLRGRVHEVVVQSGYEEDGGRYLRYGLGDQVRLLVPPDRPQDAAPSDEVRSLYAVPAGVGLIGSTALGFGLLHLTQSAEVAVALLAGAWVGFGLVMYASRR